MNKNIPSSRELMFLTILLDGEKYGREIRNAARELGKEIALASLYATLEVMEDKLWITTRDGGRNPENGYRRRFFAITPIGKRAMLI